MVEPRVADTCSACGSELSSERGTGGLCPGCLLELGFESPGLFDPSSGLEETETLAFHPDSLAEGQVLGNRYRIRALLGRGGMGEVWRAVDLKLRVEVALKSLRSRLLADQRALETLRQEVRMAREVVSPNVCRVFDLVELDGRELVSMEYIDGITLWDILRARAPLPLSEAREIAAQFLAGLEAIHEAGLAHRDVKPENLMMTRAGRVVLMDLGIAKGMAEERTGTVSGTPAYMAPEQARGEAADARADVFSAGVVLAEMIAPEGLSTLEARQTVWQGIHRNPPDLPDTPWASVLKKAVAHRPEHRFPTAAALARALEEVTLRVERAEEVTPYPGLASFTQENADYFFGRELEVEEMWKKLRRPHLLGLIGPSGAGKSSFLRAGLLAVTPTGWRAVVTTPGTQPFANLAGALVPEVSGDTDALQLLVQADDPDSVSKVVSGWRQQHDQVLIVLDQFEELFTLNPPEVQERFAALVARLALDADAHVLLAMRDDFLFHCHAFPPLHPILSELTLLGAPKGTALRRALVQPALKCGYRFEDESLVDEMVAEVATERGALPMLAFAASRLWEHRDRDEGLLTREAYEHIGGVGGALAQHAEATLERIGQDLIPIVRELFRNLVTAQGTRAARTRDELLSVFGVGAPLAGAREGASPSPTAAGVGESKRPGTVPAEVLDTLIDARLLTSYELPAQDDEDAPQQRIEIIHESLLSNWPRLVRWQAQDEEGAILRDQLRQAAQMWEERGHPEDLLWTGTSYNEYQLWRERYAGGLSSSEEIFAEAMTAKAQRRKRRRRLATAGAFVLLLVVLVVVGTFWRQSVTQALRAESQQLLALGRLEIDDDPSGALAYAIASLERADDPVTRLFALEALWRGPPALILEGTPTDPVPAFSVSFSADGNWLAWSSPVRHRVDLMLWPSDGGTPSLLDSREKDLFFVGFGGDSDRLVTRTSPSHEIQIWSVPDGRLVRTLPTQGPVDFRLAANPGRVFTFTRQGEQTRVEAWPLDEGGPQLLGEVGGALYEAANWAIPWSLDIDPTASRLAFTPRTELGSSSDPWPIFLVSLGDSSSTLPLEIGRHPDDWPGELAFHPGGRLLASTDVSGEVRIWDLEHVSGVPERVLWHPPGWFGPLRFDSAGRRLAAPGKMGVTALWDLEGPPDARPLLLTRGQGGGTNEATFHPHGKWLATASDGGLALWPTERSYPVDLVGHDRPVNGVAFLPDRSSLASVSQDGTLRLWPLSPAAGYGSRVLLDVGDDWLNFLAVDPAGERILVAGSAEEIWLVPVDGGEPRQLEIDAVPGPVALGEHTAAARMAPLEDRGNHIIRVWDLETGGYRDLETGSRIWALEFTDDGRLISGCRDGIWIWNLEDGDFETLSERPGWIARLRDGRLLVGHLSDRENILWDPVLFDLETRTSVALDSYGSVQDAVMDDSGTILATQPANGGWLEVGATAGGSPHLLAGQVSWLGPISPDGRWLTSVGLGEEENIIRLWPMPDLSRPPLHTLPHDELLAKLRTLTNLRVVKDPESETGWGWALDPFPGWEQVSTW